MSIHDHVNSGFPRRLKQAREDAAMSQRDCSFPGCSAVYVCRMERGDRTPSLQVLHELARRLGVDELWLAYGEGGREPKLQLRVPLPSGLEPGEVPGWAVLDIVQYAEGVLATAAPDSDQQILGVA